MYVDGFVMAVPKHASMNTRRSPKNPETCGSSMARSIT